MNEIDYSDKDEWKGYVNDYAIPLRDSAEVLAEYWRYSQGEIDSVPFNEIENEKSEVTKNKRGLK